MKFYLKYDGILKANGKKEDKYHLRECFHTQLQDLWNYPPLNTQKKQLDEEKSLKAQLTKNIGPFEFVFPIAQNLGVAAQLDIFLLAPGVPGKIIHRGDIDNRLKTLFDSLRCPKDSNEIPKGKAPKSNQKPFHCLMEDDNLITSIKVTYDLLLAPKNANDVSLLIHVIIKKITGTWYAVAIGD